MSESHRMVPKRPQLRRLFLILGIALACSNVYADPPTKAEIDATKKLAVNYLMSIVQPTRGWEPPEPAQDSNHRPEWATSAFISIALIEAGEDPTKTPKFQKAVDQIAIAATMSPVVIGLRMELLTKPIFKGKYKKNIAADVQTLSKATKDGRFGYRTDRINPSEMWITYIAWCGLNQAKIPEDAWKSLSHTLISLQSHKAKQKPVPGYPIPRQEYGGWPEWGEIEFGATESATVLLAIAKDKVRSKSDKDAIDSAMKDGIECLDAGVQPSQIRGFNLYGSHLLRLQYLAKLTNHKKFGDIDINEIGAQSIVKGDVTSIDNGRNLELKVSQGDRPDLIAADLLFLARL